MGQLSDRDWMLKQISLSRSRENLHFLAGVIKDAKEDGEEFTKDEETMRVLKEHWIKRMNTIKQSEK